MNILGIETSCDETAASVVKDGTEVLSNVVVSSLNEHRKYGGIVPEIASRRQMQYIHKVTDRALEDSRLRLKDIDAIAVTKSPGLIGSLLVGTGFARAMGDALDVPVLDIDHIRGHLYANFLKERKNGKHPEKRQRAKLPAIGLVVSGGHTSLFYIKDHSNYREIGHTIDDAAGEAFDKVARIMDLGYPGGPVIDRMAQKIRKTSVAFRCAALEGNFNFSFSGIKTAVLYYVRDHGHDKNFSAAEVVHAFQKSVVSVLVEKSIAACQKHGCRTLLIGGGVAANSRLRRELTKACRAHNIDFFSPPIRLCLDNAAMIAGLGFHSLN